MLMHGSRYLVRLVVVALLAVALAGGFSAVAAAEPPSDDLEVLVDVGGHRLYVHCMGRGGPTVILEAGLGNHSGVWDLVQPGVAAFTTVCSYDRANRGKSDPGPVPRTSHTAVDELRALLQRAGIRGPRRPFLWRLARPAVRAPGRRKARHRRRAGRRDSAGLARRA